MDLIVTLLISVISVLCSVDGASKKKMQFSASAGGGSGNSRKHLESPTPDYVLWLKSENGSDVKLFAYKQSLVDQTYQHLPRDANLTLSVLPDGAEAYDDKGAMYFAIVIVLLYGISIALLIATTLKRSRTDDELKYFLRSYDQLKKEKRLAEKHEIHRFLLQRSIGRTALPVFPECTLAVATAFPLCRSVADAYMDRNRFQKMLMGQQVQQPPQQIEIVEVADINDEHNDSDISVISIDERHPRIDPYPRLDPGPGRTSSRLRTDPDSRPRNDSGRDPTSISFIEQQPILYIDEN